MASNNLFAGMMEVPTNGTTITYGMQQLVVEAEVTVMLDEGTTAGQLVAFYAEQMELPSGLVVYVDGELWPSDVVIPKTAISVVMVKPSGEKGCDIPRVELADEDAVTIEIHRIDSVQYYTIVANTEFEVPESALKSMELTNGREIIRILDGTAVIGTRTRQVECTDEVVTKYAVIRRRYDVERPMTPAGIALSYGAYIMSLMVNGEACEVTDQPLNAGDHAVMVISGVVRHEHYNEYLDRIEEKKAARLVELNAMGWTELRAYAASKGVNAYGKGRNRLTVTADLVAAEFAVPTESETDPVEEYEI